MSVKSIKLNNRSKKYSSNFQKIKALVEKKNGFLSVEEAVEALFSLEQPNYKNGASVELHFKLNIDPSKSDQQVRGSLVLPHGTGKKVVVAAFVNPENEAVAKKAGADEVGGDDLIEKVKKQNKVFFDKAVAEPEMMKKLPVIARVLGVAGVMPNPKNGTVGNNIEEMIKTIKAGKIDYKNDKTGNVHFLVGKINKDFDQKKLVENINLVIEAVKKSKPEAVKKKYLINVSLCATTSPAIKIQY